MDWAGLQSQIHFLRPISLAIPDPLGLQSQPQWGCNPCPTGVPTPIPMCASLPSLCSPCSKALEPSPASHPHDPHQFIQPLHHRPHLHTGVDSLLSTIGVELPENLPARYGGGRTGGEGLSPVPSEGPGEEWGRIPLVLSFGRESQRLGPAVPAGCPARTPLRAARSPQEIPGSVWPLEQRSLFLGTSKI